MINVRRIMPKIMKNIHPGIRNDYFINIYWENSVYSKKVSKLI
jgi:hypothetical protein